VVKPGRKVEAIANFPRPKDAHEIRRFLGLSGYFRRFIVNYAMVAEPLTRLTGKDVPYQCGPSQETAFENLKKVLSSEPVVRMYDPSGAVTEVHTDTSSKALSGILLQGPRTTDLHMVYATVKKDKKRRVTVSLVSFRIICHYLDDKTSAPVFVKYTFYSGDRLPSLNLFEPP